MLKKKIVCVFTIISLLLCPLSASAIPVDIDGFLIEAGFPQDLVNEMSDPQKEYIYEHSVGKNVEFCGYDSKEFVVTNEGELVESTGISPRDGLISSSDMTLSVTGTKVWSTSGDEWHVVYPSFKWHTHKKVANDSFAMNMYSGWECRPGKRNFRLHLMNNQGQSVQYVDLAPAQSGERGYVFKIPSNTGFMQALYEGYAYFNIDKISETASPRITLFYAHDASSSCNTSFSLTLGPVGISFSGGNSNLYTMSDNFEVPRLLTGE